MLILIYIAAITLANISAATFGPQITPLNSFLFIGLDLALRNWLGANYKAHQMIALIAAAAGVSYLLNPAAGAIATASAVSFSAAALVDWAVFKTTSGEWIKRCLFGVTAGALVDSILFPTLAFGGLMPTIVAMQFAAKVSGGSLWAYMFAKVQK